MPPPKKEKVEGGPDSKDVNEFMKPVNLEKQKDEVLELYESSPIIDAKGKDPLEGLVPPIPEDKPAEEGKGEEEGKEEKSPEGDGDEDAKEKGEGEAKAGDDGVSKEGEEGEPLSEEEQLAELTRNILGEVDDGGEGDGDKGPITIDGREYTPGQIEQIIRQFANLQPQYDSAVDALKKMGGPAPVDGAPQPAPGMVTPGAPAPGVADLLTPEARVYIDRMKEADPQAGAFFESMFVRQAQLENFVVNQGQATTVATRNQAVLTGFNNGVAQLLQEPEYNLLANPKVATRFGQLALQMTQGQSPEILTNVMFLRGVYGRMVAEATAKGTRQSAKTKAKRAASESKAAGSGGSKSGKTAAQEEMDDLTVGAIRK